MWPHYKTLLGQLLESPEEHERIGKLLINTARRLNCF